jgi:photosynthetic reaction center H subunit
MRALLNHSALPGNSANCRSKEIQMHTGAITHYIDVAQLALYGFWIFFAGLIYYLRREDKREGYPLETEGSRRGIVQGFPPMPKAKTFLLQHGGVRIVPDPNRTEPPITAALPTGRWPGSPLEPTGDPMRDAVGPASYANRADTPDLTIEGYPRIVPMRVAAEFTVAQNDPDPRGMEVRAIRGEVAGVVRDIWVDRSESVIRYLEVEVTTLTGTRRVLLPINFTRIDGRRRRVRVKAIHAEHFAFVPPLAKTDTVTLREEDRIMAYYGGGHLYATPARLGPLL